MFLNGSIGIPPSEIILIICGVIIVDSNMHIFPTLISSLLGSMLSALLLYYFGKMYGYERLINSRLSKYISFDKLSKGIHIFKIYGDFIILIGRFIPGVRSQISIPAGIYEMSLNKFIGFSFIGFLIWNIFWIYIGIYLGGYIDLNIIISNMLEVKIKIFYFLLVCLLIFFILYKIFVMRK